VSWGHWLVHSLAICVVPLLFLLVSVTVLGSSLTGGLEFAVPVAAAVAGVAVEACLYCRVVPLVRAA
jgi:hypothetical protein